MTLRWLDVGEVPPPVDASAQVICGVCWQKLEPASLPRTCPHCAAVLVASVLVRERGDYSATVPLPHTIIKDLKDPGSE